MVCRILTEGLALVSAGAMIVNFPEEMFNDAMYFLEQAKNLSAENNNTWLRWRYLRASIIFSFSSFESYLNSFIKARIQVIPDKAFANVFDEAKFSWQFSLDTIFPELTGQKIANKLLKEAKRIARIRNSLVHYSGDTQRIYEESNPEGINVNNAEKGVQMVRDMIKQMNNLVGLKYPPWVDRIRSRTIR
jgi:hypothetical protein